MKTVIVAGATSAQMSVVIRRIPPLRVNITTLPQLPDSAGRHMIWGSGIKMI